MITERFIFAMAVVLATAGCATAPPEVMPVWPSPASGDGVVNPLAVLQGGSAGPKVIIADARLTPKAEVEVAGEFFLSHKCTRLMPGTQHAPSIVLDLLVRYEESYGEAKVREDLGPLLRPNYGMYCSIASAMNLADVIENPVTPVVDQPVTEGLLPGMVSVKLLSVSVEFPEEFWRAMALKAVPKVRAATAPAKAAVKK